MLLFTADIPCVHSNFHSRTSKTANKLKVLPSTSTPIESIDEEEDSDEDEQVTERTKRSAKAAALDGQSEPEGVEVSLQACTKVSNESKTC